MHAVLPITQWLSAEASVALTCICSRAEYIVMKAPDGDGDIAVGIGIELLQSGQLNVSGEVEIHPDHSVADSTFPPISRAI